MCTYVRCVVRCCANLKFTIRLFLVCEQRAITIVVKKERVESMVPKILELSGKIEADFFEKIKRVHHIGTECPLSGPKFSSAETGMGVTSRP